MFKVKIAHQQLKILKGFKNLKLCKKLGLMFFNHNHNLNSTCTLGKIIIFDYVIRSIINAISCSVPAEVLLLDAGLCCIIIINT